MTEVDLDNFCVSLIVEKLVPRLDIHIGVPGRNNAKFDQDSTNENDATHYGSRKNSDSDNESRMK